jgi:hypothetical protein
MIGERGGASKQSEQTEQQFHEVMPLEALLHL